MEYTNYIKFLGTAGARFAVARQLRSSAGTYIRLKGKNLVLDPGPGTLVKLATSRPKIDISSLDAIILTHAHIDHSNDVNVLIDGMTDGGIRKRGVLFAPRQCIEGENAIVLNYLKNFLKDIVILEAEKNYFLDDLEFSTSIEHKHGVETYGISLAAGKKVSFMVDTQYFPDLIDSYKASELLVMNVVLKDSHPKIKHLSLQDVKRILEILTPKQAILTHFGMSMLKIKPWEAAARLSEETGVKVVAATDGMSVNLGDE